jgi:hypothetical protein
LSNEPDPTEVDEATAEAVESDAPTIPPAGYIPGGEPVAGQNVGDRGEIIGPGGAGADLASTVGPTPGSDSPVGSNTEPVTTTEPTPKKR